MLMLLVDLIVVTLCSSGSHNKNKEGVDIDLNVLTISKDKVSLLVDNTNVVSGPVFASALIKKKKRFIN